jgi:hypothetical protein
MAQAHLILVTYSKHSNPRRRLSVPVGAGERHHYCAFDCDLLSALFTDMVNHINVRRAENSGREQAANAP